MRKLYKKYIPEDEQVLGVIHGHWLIVFQDLVLWFFFGIFIPLFFFLISDKVQELIPSHYFYIYLTLVIIKILYEIINWWNDVWILTQNAIYDLEWSLLKTKVENLYYENIEGIEVDKHRIWDSIFRKWDLIIHKFWEEELAIYNVWKPYKAADMIDQFLQPIEEEKDKFDMIMDTLGGVVHEYLDRNGLDIEWNKIQKKEEDIDPYTIDVR